jgi:hypothetical protein
MRAGHRLSLIVAFALWPACQAGAQNMPWPSDGARPGGAAAPWPGAGAPAAAPMGAMTPMMSPAPVAGPGFGGPPAGAGPGGVPPCLTEFTRLREEVEKKGKAAKAAGEHKATREEMCKYITTYSQAEAKWVKFTESSVATCGIPAQLAQQLKTIHTHTEQTREKICAAATTNSVAAAPSLSDALGTNRLPTPETTKTGAGTLDTLTGNAIQR